MAFLTTHTAPCGPLTRRRISIFDMIALYRQRRDLARLDDRMLRDLGLTREEAETEARRPFWDFPEK